MVVSAGKMDKTVKVRVPGQRWNKKIGKVIPAITPPEQIIHMMMLITCFISISRLPPSI